MTDDDDCEVPEYGTVEAEVFERGITWTIGQLQRVLGVKEWSTSGGGTETLDGDVRSELHDLLKAAGRDDDSMDTMRNEIEQLRANLVKEGPLNAERWTLDELLAELEKWKRVASGQTCVSFENICYGASSLWHQTHRDNFRKIDRKPEELSRWVLDNFGSVSDDFPAQVLSVLKRLKADVQNLSADEAAA